MKLELLKVTELQGSMTSNHMTLWSILQNKDVLC